MRVVNYSRFRTDDLTRLLAAVARREFEPARMRELRVYVFPGRRTDAGRVADGVMGRASLGTRVETVEADGTRSTRIRLGSIYLWLSQRQPPTPVAVAYTAAHEMGHAKGLRHRDMRGVQRYACRAAGYEWAAAFPLRLTATAPTRRARRTRRRA